MIPKYIPTESELEGWEEESLEGLRDYIERQQESRRRLKHLKRLLEAKQTNPKAAMLRTSAASRYIGVSEWKLRQLVLSGQIHVIKEKYWLFSITDLNQWIKANRERESL